MNILVTGASGMIGSALTPFLTSRGHHVVKLVRSGARPDIRSAHWDPAAGKIDLKGAGPLDAVVHLAGETIGSRWTAERKRRIRESRIQGTRLLCEALGRLSQRPRTLISASAVGFYGDRGEEWLEEESGAGQGYLAELSGDWEAATATATRSGIRVVHLRFGIVLAPRGGALAKMLPAFKWGLGGKLGGGGHYWSWIAIDDVLGAIQHILKAGTLNGPVNAVSPNPVSNLEFTRTLGRVLRRPTVFAVPRFALELLFGEMAREALLSSARVKPAKLLADGFEFLFPELEPALRHLLDR
ncbi:MAG TPA: TIGR01777 family oxidoreductase [Candidatus Nitrosotalea sp.]|nr:TIGR01777 family oxidoreductase [Candidatus Nitrosotalea sp.]